MNRCGAVLSSIFRRPFRAIDDDGIERSPTRFQLQTELFLDRCSQTRSVIGFLTGRYVFDGELQSEIVGSGEASFIEDWSVGVDAAGSQLGSELLNQ